MSFRVERQEPRKPAGVGDWKTLGDWRFQQLDDAIKSTERFVRGQPENRFRIVNESTGSVEHTFE